jgi:hypothetical protein
MSKRIHIIGIIAIILYFLSVGYFLISKTDVALTIWELMTVAIYQLMVYIYKFSKFLYSGLLMALA